MLACRLYNMTADAGMQDMLSFLIARDTMHQQQWLAVIEDLGGMQQQLPVPNTFPQNLENQDSSYVQLGFTHDGAEPPRGRRDGGGRRRSRGGVTEGVAAEAVLLLTFIADGRGADAAALSELRPGTTLRVFLAPTDYDARRWRLGPAGAASAMCPG